MKKVITLLSLFFFSFVAVAQMNVITQTQRGNFIVGSRIGFSTAKSSVDVQATSGNIKGDGGSASQFNLSPAIGYFFLDNFALGISMDWLRTTSSTGIDLNGNNASPQETDNNNLLFGPFVRFFLPFDDKAFFIGSTVGFGNSRNQFVSDGKSQSINNNILSVSVGPGFTIFSKNGIALEALVKYNFARSKSEIDLQSVKRFSTTWTNAVDFSVGMHYYFSAVRSSSAVTPGNGNNNGFIIK